MKTCKRVSLMAFWALIASMASSLMDAKVIAIYPDIMGCESGCLMSAAGWPFPYLIDYPGISPVGSVSLINAILGIDRVWFAQLAETFIFWFVLSGIAGWSFAIVRRSKRNRS